MFISQFMFQVEQDSRGSIAIEDIITLIQKSFGLPRSKNAAWKVSLRKIIKEDDKEYRISVRFNDEESILNFARKSNPSVSVSVQQWEMSDSKIMYVMILVKYR